ncbi:MAG: hypothetical protein ACTSWN_05590 [Promethearchaeota archaeon]
MIRSRPIYTQSSIGLVGQTSVSPINAFQTPMLGLRNRDGVILKTVLPFMSDDVY